MEYWRVTQPINNAFELLETSSSALDNAATEQDSENEEADGALDPFSSIAEQFAGLEEKGLEELIALIVEQDQAAFSALFKAMSARVHGLALRITSSVQLAEEVTEDVFFQVWRQAPRFDPTRGTVRAWILTIARSRALDARRSLPPFDYQGDTATDSLDNQDGQNDLPDLLSAIEQKNSLYQALESLETVPRQLIALSFFKGLSHEEIAGHTGLPLGTVKSHLRRAIIHLREILTEQIKALTNEK
jgi:RNA polymerase sigma factor (sigma-70 family)